MKGALTLKKGIKILLALLAIGAVVALIVNYFVNGSCGCDDDEDFFDEDDDFDLDDDLKATADREYVNLTKAVDNATEEVKNNVEKAKEVVEEVADQVKEAVS